MPLRRRDRHGRRHTNPNRRLKPAQHLRQPTGRWVRFTTDRDGPPRGQPQIAYTQAINQLHALVVTAPDQVNHQLGNLSAKAIVKVCAAFRPNTDHTTINYTKKTLRLLAHRYQALTTEIE